MRVKPHRVADAVQGADRFRPVMPKHCLACLHDAAVTERW